MIWTGVVLARSDEDGDGMVSSLPAHFHPVAGRPLLWHTVHALAQHEPESILVAAAPEAVGEMFEGFSVPVEVVAPEGLAARAAQLLPDRSRCVLVEAGASLEPGNFTQLLGAESGAWIGPDREAAAVLIDGAQLADLIRHLAPFRPGNGTLSPLGRLESTPEPFVVKTRADLVRVHRRIRDQLVRSLMDGGATFLLPDSVIVDVDVRIGRDTVIYPGVVLEGQTTIGEETVIGPGCRIIDSWVGSGVELKGWNYIAHTSVRNRAILEPYVRRGFD